MQGLGHFSPLPSVFYHSSHAQIKMYPGKTSSTSENNDRGGLASLTTHRPKVRRMDLARVLPEGPGVSWVPRLKRGLPGKVPFVPSL
jgi:hypothetical protein